MGVLVLLALVVGVFILVLFYRSKATEARRAELLAKYKDETIVSRILAKEIWIGETHEQLLDSLGQPHDIDQKVLKTKKKEPRWPPQLPPPVAGSTSPT